MIEPAVRAALREAGWDAFFGAHGDGQPLWASKRASVAALLRAYRAAALYAIVARAIDLRRISRNAVQFGRPARL